MRFHLGEKENLLQGFTSCYMSIFSHQRRGRRVFIPCPGPPSSLDLKIAARSGSGSALWRHRLPLFWVSGGGGDS